MAAKESSWGSPTWKPAPMMKDGPPARLVAPELLLRLLPWSTQPRTEPHAPLDPLSDHEGMHVLTGRGSGGSPPGIEGPVHSMGRSESDSVTASSEDFGVRPGGLVPSFLASRSPAERNAPGVLHGDYTRRRHTQQRLRSRARRVHQHSRRKAGSPNGAKVLPRRHGCAPESRLRVRGGTSAALVDVGHAEVVLPVPAQALGTSAARGSRTSCSTQSRSLATSLARKERC